MSDYAFDDDVRTTLDRAREESRKLNHEYVGTEHLLLSIVAEPTNRGVEILRRLSVDPAEVRDLIVATVKKGGSAVPADLPYTSRSKKVFELALEAARERNQSVAGVDYLLLGLLREKKGIAAQVLHDRGVTLERVEAEVKPSR
jgi:ATP-dependent Clp protease ATP-binding subunit ClpC